MALKPSALFVPEIKEMIDAKDWRELKRALAQLNPVDMAEGFDAFSPFEKLIVFKLLPVVRAMELFEELEPKDQAYFLSTLEPGVLGPLLEGMPPKEAQFLFHKMPERMIKRMISQARHSQREGAVQPADYPPHTVGSLMHPEVLELRPGSTAQQALEIVRGASRLHRMHDLHVLYVTDQQGRLLGSLSPRALIAAPRDMRLSEIMSPVQLVKVRADMDQEEAAKLFQRFKLIAAPVVDAENRLVGVLSSGDILTVVSEEATEDIAKMAGTGAEELETGSLLRVARLRMPWLLASWIGGLGASLVISRFEAALSKVVVLAAFMPVIAGMGGNVGTQSSTIVVRGLATGHIRVTDILRMTWRELRVGVLLGLVYGVLLGVVTSIRYGGDHTWTFPLVVGLGICTSMTVAATMGALTPIIVKRCGIDPAICSAPFVSTATDLLSLATYFSLASWLLL